MVFYLNSTSHNGWVTADGTYDEGYGWYGWDGFNDTIRANRWRWEGSHPGIKLTRIKWIYYVNGTSFHSSTQKWDDYDDVAKDSDDEVDSDWVTWDYYKGMFNYTI